MVLYVQHNSVVGKAGGETDFAWMKSLVAGTFLEPAERLSFLPALMNPKPSFRCQLRLTVSVETKRQPHGTQDFSRPWLLQVLPRHMDMLLCFSLPAARVSDSGSGERWSCQEGKCAFSWLLFMSMAEGTASTFFSVLDPLFALQFVLY